MSFTKGCYFIFYRIGFVKLSAASYLVLSTLCRSNWNFPRVSYFSSHDRQFLLILSDLFSDSVFEHPCFFLFFTVVVPVLLHFQAALRSSVMHHLHTGQQGSGTRMWQDLGGLRLWPVTDAVSIFWELKSRDLGTIGRQRDNGLTFPEVFFFFSQTDLWRKGSWVIFTTVYCRCIKLHNTSFLFQYLLVDANIWA